jgi:hypothetical protein
MDDPRSLWQNQEVEEMKFSAEELRAAAAKFQGRIRRRNVREYLAALAVIAIFGRLLWETSDTIERIGFALVIAGSIYYIWHLWKWGSAKFPPSEMGHADCVRFYRGELERQRDLVRSVWKWAIGPIIPGLAVGLIYGIATTAPNRRWYPILSTVAVAAVLATVGWLNQRAAHRLNGRIAELDREMGNA